MTDLSDPYFKVTQEWLDAEWEQQNRDLAEIGEVLDEMMRDAEIDVFHRRRSTNEERVAYVTELVAHASDHALAMARRELRLLNTTTDSSTLSLKRRVLERPKRPSQIYPTHYQNRST